MDPLACGPSDTVSNFEDFDEQLKVRMNSAVYQEPPVYLGHGTGGMATLFLKPERKDTLRPFFKQQELQLGDLLRQLACPVPGLAGLLAQLKTEMLTRIVTVLVRFVICKTLLRWTRWQRYYKCKDGSATSPRLWNSAREKMERRDSSWCWEVHTKREVTPIVKNHQASTYKRICHGPPNNHVR